MTPINPYEPPRSSQVLSPVSALPVRASGVLAPEDALSALAVLGKWQVGRLRLWSLILLVIAGGLLLITWRGRVWFVPLIFCFACVFLLALSFRVKARFVQSWHGRPEHAQPIVWTFSDEGLFVEAINSKHLYSWQAYVDALIAADKIILAQQGGQMFNFIPRRCFETDTDWQTVCQLVASKLPVRQTNR